LEEGTLSLNGGTISGDGNFNSSVGSTLHLAGTIFFSGNGNFISRSQITGDAGLVKTGAGTLYLGGDSSYDGVTSIRGGELVVGNTTGSATGISRVQIRSGAKLSGHGSIGDEVTVAGGGSVSPGTTTG
ncbi:unnamed protein product, partial [Ectocarpus sp. 4 AP-2014]